MNKLELKKALWKEIGGTGKMGLIILVLETAWIVLDPSDNATKEGIKLGNELMILGGGFCLGLIGLAELKVRHVNNMIQKNQ